MDSPYPTPPAKPPAWKWVAWAHAAYFAVTGIWPIVHLESFLAVTGPKTDLWLVQFFGALVCVPAAVIAHAAWSNQPHGGMWVAAIVSCIVLAAGDVIFVLRGTIGPIYLADAAVEIALLGAWVWAARQNTAR